MADDSLTLEELENETIILVGDILGIAQELIGADRTHKYIYANPLSFEYFKKKEEYPKQRELFINIQDEDVPINVEKNFEDDQEEINDQESKRDSKRISDLSDIEKEYFNLMRYSIISKSTNKFTFLLKDLFERNTVSLTASTRSTLESFRRSIDNDTWMENVSTMHSWKSVRPSHYSHKEDSKEDLSEFVEDELSNFKWTSIEEFTVDEICTNIMSFIGLWSLSPITKYCLLPDQFQVVQCDTGDHYLLCVGFSQPTPVCPNPIAVAKVYFDIYKSHVMPPHFQVNVTYRFEGYKSKYNIHGRECMRSTTFQMYFIESILKAKLSFYVEMFETQNGSVYDKPKKFTLEEEMELFDKQQEISNAQYHATVPSSKYPKRRESIYRRYSGRLESQAVLNQLLDRYLKRERVLKEFGFHEFPLHFNSKNPSEDSFTRSGMSTRATVLVPRNNLSDAIKTYSLFKLKKS